MKRNKQNSDERKLDNNDLSEVTREISRRAAISLDHMMRKDGVYADYQIVVRCAAQPERHAKILRMRACPLEYVEIIARLLDGTSAFYIHKPGPDSPIGKCATCGAKYTATIEEVEVKNADSKR